MTYKDGEVLICAYRSNGFLEVSSIFKQNTYQYFSTYHMAWREWREEHSAEKYQVVGELLMTLEDAFAERNNFHKSWREVLWQLL